MTWPGLGLKDQVPHPQFTCPPQHISLAHSGECAARELFHTTREDSSLKHLPPKTGEVITVASHARRCAVDFFFYPTIDALADAKCGDVGDCHKAAKD